MTFEAIVREWAGPLGLALAAMLAGLIAYRVSRPIALRLTRHTRVLRAVAERMDGPLHLMLPLAALAVVLDSVPDTVPGIDGIRHCAGVLLIAAGTWVAVGAVQGVGDGVAVLHPQDVDDNLRARRD